MKGKYVFSFNAADPGNKSLFGGKGAGLAGMTQLGLPIPKGFVITTEACQQYLAGSNPVGPDSQLMEEVAEHIHQLENRTGLIFGQDLLVSVRSGAPVSMPGMMDTVLNLGAHVDGEDSFRNWASEHGRIWDELENTWIESSVDDEMLWLKVHQQFLVQMGKVALGMDHSARLSKPEAMYKSEYHIPPDAPLNPTLYREMVAKIYARIAREGHEELLNDPWTQLRAAITAVFRSWTGHKAKAYRAHHGIDASMGTAVSVVMMVYGNLNSESGTGVMFTRNPASGENKIYGEYLSNAQGEALVSGESQPEPIEILKDSQPVAFNELVRYGKMLEKDNQDVQDIEFTIQAGELFLLQHRSAKRTTRAALVSAIDMVDEKLITQEEAIERIPLEVLNSVGKPSFGASGGYLLGTGLPASPGLVSGVIAYSSTSAVQYSKCGDDVVLVREFTSTEDIEGMLKAKAIVTGTGGLTCHAAVVARDLGIACVVGCKTAIDSSGRLIHKGTILNEGDWISVDGYAGEIFEGKHGVVFTETADHYTARFKEWVGDIEVIDIDLPEDAKTHVIGIEEISCGLTPKLELLAREDKGWWDELFLSLDLSQLCADFYLLSDLTMRNPEIKDSSDEYAEVLARQFAVYVDAACGGEARHKKHEYKGLPKGDRSLARKEWRKIRKAEGIPAMQDLEKAFFTPNQWGGAMGGKNWGRAANLLNRFLTCEISPTMFIDMVFDLEHNTGCLFNKLSGTVYDADTESKITYRWNFANLKHVLGLKFEGDIEHLSQLASVGMRSLFESYTPGDTIVVEGAEVAMSSLKYGESSLMLQVLPDTSHLDITVGCSVRVRQNCRIHELRGLVGSVLSIKPGDGNVLRGKPVKIDIGGLIKTLSSFNLEIVSEGNVSGIEGHYREYF